MRSQIGRQEKGVASAATATFTFETDGQSPTTVFVENMDQKASLIMRTGGNNAGNSTPATRATAYATQYSKNGCLKFEAVAAGVIGNNNTIEITAAASQAFSIADLGSDDYRINLKCDASGKPIQLATEILQAIVAEAAGEVTTLSQVWQVVSAGPTFVDETVDANSAAANDWQFFPAGAAADYAAIGYTKKFSKLTVNVGTPGVGTYTVAWQYWNGTAWAALTGVVDGTTSFKTGGSNTVTFVVPADWAALVLNGSASLFYIRALKDLGTVTTTPLGTQGSITGPASMYTAAINTTLAPGSDGSATMDRLTADQTHVIAAATALAGGTAATVTAAGATLKLSPTPTGPFITDISAGALDAVAANTVKNAFIVDKPAKAIRVEIIGGATGTWLACSLLVGAQQ